MEMKCKKKVTLFMMCMMLIVAMALFTTGCNSNNSQKNETISDTGTESIVSEETNVQGKETSEGTNVLGEGNTQFLFTVVDQEGTETVFEIHTEKEIVGEALLELGLISGEEGPYGLYVKTVNGTTVDYDKDGKYWSFYVNEEYAISGVDSTKITEGDSYSFKVE